MQIKKERLDKLETIEKKYNELRNSFESMKDFVKDCLKELAEEGDLLDEDRVREIVEAEVEEKAEEVSEDKIREIAREEAEDVVGSATISV
jgi:predicted nuclease with TOPRIM domain